MPIHLYRTCRQFSLNLFFILSAVFVLLTGFIPSSTYASDIKPAPADACESLERADFSGVLDAPTQLIKAQPVKATGSLPAYCVVEGYVTPNVGFEIKFPTDSWNGKFLQVGCGGWCGSTLFSFACEGPLSRGYACIASDMGHKSTTTDAKWAYNNLQA